MSEVILTAMEKLERERDEAREHLSAANHFLEKFISERDEAREKAERYRLEANAMMMQRDEAREQERIHYDNLIIMKEQLAAERALADRLVAFAETIVDALGPYPDLNGHQIVQAAYAELAAWKEARND